MKISELLVTQKKKRYMIELTDSESNIIDECLFEMREFSDYGDDEDENDIPFSSTEYDNAFEAYGEMFKNEIKDDTKPLDKGNNKIKKRYFIELTDRESKVIDICLSEMQGKMFGDELDEDDNEIEFTDEEDDREFVKAWDAFSNKIEVVVNDNLIDPT